MMHQRYDLVNLVLFMFLNQEKYLKEMVKNGDMMDITGENVYHMELYTMIQILIL